MNDPSHIVGTLAAPAAPPVPGESTASNGPVASQMPRPTALGKVLGGLPTLVVVGLLAGLAWWGHQTGWAIPKFSDMIGAAQAKNGDWCDAHAVPESQCVECNPSLAPHKQYGWCAEHGVQNCPFEHPEVAQLATIPTITQAQLDLSKRTLAFKEWPENSPTCKKVQRLIQFAQADTLKKMNVRVHPVQVMPIMETVSASGELRFMPKAVGAASSSVAGRVWQVTGKGRLGGSVQQGDVLAVIDAPDVGKARAEFLHAYAHLDSRKQFLDRAQKLFYEGAGALARVMESQALFDEANIRLKAAHQALINLGLPVEDTQIKGMSSAKLADELPLLGLPADVAKLFGKGKLTANLLPLRAPRSGVITEVKVNDGETVEPFKTLFVVAQASKLWQVLNVRQEDVKFLRPRITDPKTGQLIKPGQTVLVKPPGSYTDVKAELVWKSTTADEATRTVQFAAELPNDTGQFLAHSFVTGRIVIRQEKEAMTVPSSAVHWEGDCHVVFVRDKNWGQPDAPVLFHVRTVRPGITIHGTTGPETEIIAGVLPGEVVATTNSAALRAELLKNNLGAG